MPHLETLSKPISNCPEAVLTSHFTNLILNGMVLTIVNSMKTMSKLTRLSSEKIIAMAKEYFLGRFGFRVVEEYANCCVAFENDIGFVNVEVVDKGDCREMTLTTREWEYQIQEFLGKTK